MTIALAKLKRSELYSEELAIELSSNTDEELFKWFLASMLYGARISQTIAKHTYQTFARYQLLEPQAILQAGWGFLVKPVMAEGGYVRYDEKTSTALLSVCDKLIAEYDGSLLTLHAEARDNQDLESRLIQFHGIGPVTANIFLREVRPYWKKSNPEPLPIVIDSARRLGLELSEYDRKGMAFTRVEAGLIRLRKEISQRA